MKFVTVQFSLLCAVAVCASLGFLYQIIGIVRPTKNNSLKQGIHEDKSCFLQHLTILVSDLERAKSWYMKVLPISEINRNIKTAVRGAWFDLNGIELHLLEKKNELLGADRARITGQHIGLHVGPIGEMRDKLYEEHIQVTLAPENDKAQQAMFVTDGDLMTWEFTDMDKKDKPMELVQSKTTLSAKKGNMHLNRPSASTTTATKIQEKPFKFAISSGNPIAAAAGHACLQIGGSAADATIVTATVLSVVEPFNGGLGGDFIAMLHDPKTDKDIVLNGSGRSPKNSQPLSETDTMTLDGPKSAMSVPGAAAAWCKLHEDYGKLPWEILLQPAIMLASEGFLINERTAQVWESGAKRIFNSNLETKAKEEFMAMFAPLSSNGKRMTPRANERFYNPTLSSTYQKLADGGCEWFYQEAAKSIVSHVQHHGGYEGSPDLRKNWAETKEDHAAWEEPLHTTFFTNGKEFKVMTAGGNSQAGAALMILKSLETTIPFSEARNRKTMNEVLHKHISAKRIIFRDKFRKPFTQNIIDDIEYIEHARQEIQNAFQQRVSVSMEKAPIEEAHDTEGFVVRDADGLTLSVLQSNALPFGSGITVPSLGITIHNRAFGFTTNPSDEFCFGPGKRPWTTLSPYMVKRDGKFWMAASVKGGDRQPYAFSQVFMNVAHNQMNFAEAVLHPRFRDKSHVRKDAILEFDLPPYVPSDAKVNMTEFQELREYLQSNGYTNKVYEPEEIEDSGFGLAQILIDESTQSTKEYTVITDAGRKPGLAMTGEQVAAMQDIRLLLDTHVVHPRDLEVLIKPMKEFLTNMKNRMETYHLSTVS